MLLFFPKSANFRISLSLPISSPSLHPSSNENAPRLVPVTHPALLVFVSAGVGWGCNWPSCSGESRPLVWGHKPVSLCVSAALQGQKDMLFSDTHRALFTHLPAPNNHCSYLGKVIICSPVCLLAFRALSCHV